MLNQVIAIRILYQHLQTINDKIRQYIDLINVTSLKTSLQNAASMLVLRHDQAVLSYDVIEHLVLLRSELQYAVLDDMVAMYIQYDLIDLSFDT